MSINYFKNTKIIKFVISGFLAYSAELLIFKFILEEFKIWYLMASSIALVLSFFISFTLQKFWTFKHKETVHMKGEILMYFGVVILNLVLNAVFFYVFVEFFHLPSLLGRFFDIGILKSFFHGRAYGLVLTQAMTAALVGFWNFWFYKKIIFKDHKMKVSKILFITQKLDNKDPILGFVEGWVENFSNSFESVKVICLYRGEFNLPKNIEVFSLGKEKGLSRLKILKNFYKLIINLRGDYDAVFVHMNPIYLILGGPLWLVFRKKIYLWYIHTYCDKYLRYGIFFANKVFSAFKSSFPISTKKLEAVGHGIDTNKFSFSLDESLNPKREVNFLMVGRITAVKNVVYALRAFGEIRGENIFLKIVGSPDYRSFDYETKLKQEFSDLIDKNKIIFSGSLENVFMPEIYRSSDILVNVTESGNIDKVVLEAMSCGCLVITSNPEFRGIIPNEFIVEPRDVEAIKSAMNKALSMDYVEKSYLRRKYREYVNLNHSLKNLPNKIYKIMN